MYAPVRGGNRGGWDQFKWDDVRLMSYKDREQYLGFSEKLGYLDKGGKWRKKDWWTGENGQTDKEAQEAIKREIQQAKREEEALMRQKLGLDPVKDTKVLLQELRQEGSNNGPMSGTKLSEYELKELTMRGDPKAFEQGATAEGALIDEAYLADRIGGLGATARSDDIGKKLRQQQESLEQLPLTQLNRLQSDASLSTLEQELKQVDQHKKLLMLNYLREKVAKQEEEEAREKAERKRKKKERKEAKKARKASRRKRSSSSSVSRERSRSRDRKVEERKRSRSPRRDSHKDDKYERKRSHERHEKRRDRSIERYERKRDHRHREERKRSRDRRSRSRSSAKSSSSFLSQ